MTEKNLQREAEQASYTLRSSFFYRVRSAWPELLQTLALTRYLSVSWKERKRLGISEVAWRRVKALRVDPVLVFCHPDVVKAAPPLVAYYRCLALLPQKGAQRLACSTSQLETGARATVSDKRATKLAQVFNALVSLLIESDPNWSLEHNRVAALLNLGAQVNGSWRNEIGAEGSRKVKELLFTHFVGAHLLAKAFRTDASEIKLAPGAKGVELAPIEEVRTFRTKTGFTFRFGSEPDISIRDPHGTLTCTIEVKYGLDPAGALERYGAAKKSFEQATKENRRVHNVYLASRITPEVRRRINEDRLVSDDFNLTGVLGDAQERGEFLKRIQHLISI